MTNPSQWTNGQGDGLGYATTYSYDGLGRQTQVSTADGSVATSSYTQGYTTLTDAAGNARVTYVDGLGRLAAVWEDPSHLNYQTSYTIGANDTLQKATQGSETRTFYYDSLGRLTGSTQPETGTISYTYDPAGNLATRKDARSVTTTYTYDALNRPTQIAYNDGKTYTVNLGYDAAGVANSAGHLTSMSNSTATMSFGPFSATGRRRRAAK